jgi:hypothetical protein
VFRRARFHCGSATPPRPERHIGEQPRQRHAAARFWAEERIRREDAKAAISEAARRQIGNLTKREALTAGAIAYWCEGAKNKSHRRSDRVDFINSDPRMITLFLRFLDTAGVPRVNLIYGLSIHENADIEAAQRFWREITAADPAQVIEVVRKRHNPATNRKNTGSDYHGCLRVQVRRSTELYRQIEGWAAATMAAHSNEEGGAGHVR